MGTNGPSRLCFEAIGTDEVQIYSVFLEFLVSYFQIRQGHPEQKWSNKAGSSRPLTTAQSLPSVARRHIEQSFLRRLDI